MKRSRVSGELGSEEGSPSAGDYHLIGIVAVVLIAGEELILAVWSTAWEDVRDGVATGVVGADSREEQEEGDEGTRGRRTVIWKTLCTRLRT
jgi:hypothetical protein